MAISASFDVVVVGAGHAGCEAARAAAAVGASVALVTMNADLIAQMSCNPAIGGVAKGHLVREIDALGGLMGLVADEAGIQYRLLNTSRGPAVWSPRVQCDKKRYREAMKRRIEGFPGIRIVQGEVAEVQLENGRLQGVQLGDGRGLAARAVVLTTGTFLNGLSHVGSVRQACGRNGEPPSVLLGNQLRTLGLVRARLKTGTPPRLDGRTIDWGQCERQEGDINPTPMSFLTTSIQQQQIACFLTYTDARVHDLIRANLHLSPLYTGQIEGRGPRYCPSVEDKVVRFADRDRHQIFLEPEGLDTNEVYVNGLSTSLPAEVQEQIVRALPGLERAEMIRPGYAIEYDAADSRLLDHSLQVRKMPGLFLAGQINGTSGYEEAAAQGLIGGLNAARSAMGQDPVTLRRDQAYIGVMIDDLITKGSDEPYRMFTSRAENRLELRIDNADGRLTPIGRKWGLVGDARWESHVDRQKQIASLSEWVRSARLGDGTPARVALIRQPGWLKSEGIALWGKGAPRGEVCAAVEADVRYEGYIRHHRLADDAFRTHMDRPIPIEINYEKIAGLSNEVVEKLSLRRPRTLAEAAGIPGITPAALLCVRSFIQNVTVVA